MFNLADVLDKTVISVEEINGEKVAHLGGYGYYCDDGSKTPYRFVEYTFFYIPLKRLEKEDIGDIESQESCEYKQYISDYNEEQLLHVYQHYNNGSAPILLKKEELNINTPYGMYVLI